MKIKTNAIGGQWLCEAFDLDLVNPLAVQSLIGARRHTTFNADVRTETHQDTMRPDANLRGHLTFHFKHEVVNLELLSRLFSVADKSELAAWVMKEPSSQYARRAGFLYEWLTGLELDVESDRLGGNYVEALDPKTVIVATAPVLNSRWRVRDNMPGTRFFCPTVRLTSRSRDAIALNCNALLDELQVEFGDDLLLKSAVWLTLRESKSSFQIEGEVDKKKRIERFADVLHHHTGAGALPLNQDALAMLQTAILGESTSILHAGIRQSPVFIGQTLRYEELIHYVAPPFQDVSAMLDGLKQFLDLTAGASAVMRAAVASFGFVYVHPLADGNGRVHRFLVNDILRRDGAVPAPLIIPVSGLIARDADERRAYDEVLDVVSKPLMQRYKGFAGTQGEPIVYKDGIRSNFQFSADSQARHAWRFMDMTSHVEYLSAVVVKTIRVEMRQEAAYLINHGNARDLIKELVEMPNHQIDRVIRSIEQNNGALSGKLAGEFPMFENAALWKEIVEAVRQAFAGAKSSYESDSGETVATPRM